MNLTEFGSPKQNLIGEVIHMKKIGFVDYFIDEWHSNNYINWIREQCEIHGYEYEVAYAWAETDTYEGKISTDEWCAKNNVQKCETMEELCEKSDYIMILAPSDPEKHLGYAKTVLKYGKNTYIDKTFACSRKEAEEIFANAEAHNTPCFSSSALRFANEIKAADRNGIDFIGSRGPGAFSNYAIHQVEPIVTLMGSEVRRVMSIGTARTPGLLIDFKDGRRATMNTYGSGAFNLQIKYADEHISVIPDCSDYFPNFIADLVDFFRTGDVKVSHAETIAIMGILEKGRMALDDPEHWYEI